MKIEFYRQRDAFPHTRRERDLDDEISILVDPEDGRLSNYEFKVVHAGTSPSSRKPIGLQVRIFDDAWRAFTDLPGLFEAFVANDLEHRPRKEIDLDDLAQILTALGYEDITQKFAQNAVHIQGCLTCGEVH